MDARIKNLQTILSEAWGPMVALGKSLATSPIPESAETPQRVAGTQHW